MAPVSKANGTFMVKAYRGDCKTLLAFNLDKKGTKNLAGFTIHCQPKGADGFFIQNTLQFEKPGNHAQDARLPANASINAPIHKFRWVHVPGSVHQGTKPVLGPYTYTVTPRYFDDDQSLQPLDAGRSASVTIEVNTFEKKGLELGFTRGYTQSQAFTHHFGLKAKIQPADKELIFDTTQESGVNAAGEHFTFAEEYEWLGFTAREKIFALLDEVASSKSLRLDVFAYDFNEPDVIKILLELARQGRVRVILDNAALHHSTSNPKPEDEFEKLLDNVPGGSTLIKRGKFGRYAHDKIFIVRTKATGVASKVLTGSTNFSVTGLYVNSNHILILNDPKVAEAYAAVFDNAWANDVKEAPFLESDFAKKPFTFSTAQTPKTTITFSPHEATFADEILQGVADRIAREGKKSAKVGSVLFAVMQIDTGKSVVYDALNKLHQNQAIFSYGISDSPKGISLFQPGKKTGVLVSGKPGKSTLPAPFDQVRNIGIGHQVHHKFVICGFNGPDPVVYCGSSNLASGGETDNGDNLLAVFDADVATVFAIEALLLVDHFEFLDRVSAGKNPAARKTPTSKKQAALDAHWFLSTTDAWAQRYFDPNDLHFVDRQLFG